MKWIMTFFVYLCKEWNLSPRCIVLFFIIIYFRDTITTGLGKLAIKHFIGTWKLHVTISVFALRDWLTLYWRYGTFFVTLATRVVVATWQQMCITTVFVYSRTPILSILITTIVHLFVQTDMETRGFL